MTRHTHQLFRSKIQRALLLLIMALYGTMTQAWDLHDPKVASWVEEAHGDTGIPITVLEKWLTSAEKQDQIITNMQHPAEAWPWDRYQKALISQKRALDGAAYWRKHQATLDRYAEEYQVDPALIVAIIGIESDYGRHTVSHDAFNALATLSFAYPKREHFFQQELIALVDLAWETKVDPHTFGGSYAGALGIPQFMPSNIKRFGVDGDGDQRVDLGHSHEDAIASIANFLHCHGYRLNSEPAAHRLPTDDIADSHPPKPSFSSTDVVILEDGQHHLYRYQVTENYRAIRHYNPRDAYTMAIVKLAANIRHEYVG